ncbi:MAG: hypothetical protein P4M15_03240 [Alphaproteobacteria bacterium]|nr:hypothetical protein [Alphaproteobacteria bacterium]
MSDAAEHYPIADATDEEIDAVIAEFGGDPHLAIRALLHDLTQIALDSDAAVSHGYVRGKLLMFRLRETSAKKELP